jgi:transposase
MQPIYVEKLSAAQLAELETCYRTTKSIRVRTRAQMILLSVEKRLVPHQIASIVRKDEQTVRRWIRRYQAEGLAGLEDAPRPGGEQKTTPAYRRDSSLLISARSHRSSSTALPDGFSNTLA